jgi:hypothetical protein
MEAITVKAKRSKRYVYPLDLSASPELLPLIKKAQKRTKIKSQAEVMRQALSRGLQVLVNQLEGSPT